MCRWNPSVLLWEINFRAISTAGYAMQSFFIGTGAVVASALPYMMTNWFGVTNEAAAGVVPDSVKYSFYIGALAFLLAVSWTVFKTKEYPHR